MFGKDKKQREEHLRALWEVYKGLDYDAKMFPWLVGLREAANQILRVIKSYEHGQHSKSE